MNRDQNELRLNRYNAKSGELDRTLFTEKAEKYIEPKHGPKFIPGKDDEFIWQSARDGFNHLYHYNTGGELLGQLTSGEWKVTQLLGFDSKVKTLFYASTTQAATDRHVYALDLKKKKTTLLTPGKGTHSVKMHPSGDYLIDTWTSTKVPRMIRVMDRKGKQVQQLLQAGNPLKDINTQAPEIFQIKAADGKTDLWCRMFKPTNMDMNKKHPVIVYVYNGPGVQLVRDMWNGAAPLWMNHMAQQGYIVFSVDGRGSANRGMEFEQAIFRDLGRLETDDQIAGVNYLKTLPYIDGNRMAIHGWSYGGFMTCNLMMRTPGVFNAGVAGGPVVDWDLYEVMYTERYMDTPETNAKGYKASNVREYAENLEGKLMLVHGTRDDVVVWQHSLELIETCIDKGVQLDYFVYPNHPHNVRGKDRLHLMTKVLNYLMDNNQ